MQSVEGLPTDCVPALGTGMELIDAAKPGMLVRVIPDPHKAIGANILTAFHYKRRPRIEACKTLTEAAKLMEL